jgi:hypothetical protein
MQFCLIKSLQRCTAVCALFISASTFSGSATAQQVESPSWWQQAKNKANMVIDNGKSDIYLSGYAYHGRNTYTAEKLGELNENAWGAGYGKSIRDDRGNEESLFAFGLSDSHCKPQLMAGYAYQWMWPMGQSGLEAGAGVTAMLMSRQDYFDGVPFPVLLPVTSFGTQKVRLMASYVPRLSQHKGNGDVLLVFMRIQMD